MNTKYDSHLNLPVKGKLSLVFAFSFLIAIQMGCAEGCNGESRGAKNNDR
jgi:hypothetical protein